MAAIILAFIIGAGLGVCGGFYLAALVIAKANWKVTDERGERIA